MFNISCLMDLGCSSVLLLCNHVNVYLGGLYSSGFRSRFVYIRDNNTLEIERISCIFWSYQQFFCDVTA